MKIIFFELQQLIKSKNDRAMVLVSNRCWRIQFSWIAPIGHN